MEQQHYNLSETHYKKKQDNPSEIVIIPWGATEAHNYHLPYGTDNYLTQAFAEESAKKASGLNVPVTVLPIIPFGVNTGQLDIPFTINMHPSTQTKILIDIIDSLRPFGVRKLIVFNGHGGNDFKQIIRELQGSYPEFLIFQLNYYQVLPMKDFFEDTGEHAGEMETSLMMHLFPDLVKPLTDAGKGDHKELIFKGRKEGWLWAPRKWTQISSDTGIGDPAKSSPEKGKKYYDEATNKIAEFLKELHLSKEIYK